MPVEVGEETIAASVEDGIMAIELPKSESAQKKAKMSTIERGK